MEMAVIELYVEVFLSASGTTVTADEKYARITDRLKENRKKLWWPVLCGQIVDNKIDSLKRKGKREFKAFRNVHHTGVPWEEHFDLESAYKEWVNFQPYPKLFFQKQSFSQGGYNAGTGGDRDAHGHASVPDLRLPTEPTNLQIETDELPWAPQPGSSR